MVCNRLAAAQSADMSVRPAILLQGFGMASPNPSAPSWERNGTTALFNHPDDGVAATQSREWWVTPWFFHGVSSCKRWVSEFISQYELRRAANAQIPVPGRFIFDSEGWPEVVRSPLGAVETFEAMRKDERWQSSAVFGFDAPMSALFERAGSPVLAANRPWWSLENRAWSCWYQGVLFQAADAAIRDAAFRPIENQWTGALCGNYGSSTSFDGIDERFDLVPGHSTWFRYSHRSMSSLLCPCLYPPVPLASITDETVRSVAALENADRVLRSMRDSFGGKDPKFIVPWLQLCGDRLFEGSTGPVVTEDYLRKLVQLLTKLGLREAILWANDGSWSDENWRATIRAVRG